MRLLHTEASCGWGGQEIRILTEASGLRARGHQVELACPADARIFTEAARFGVPVHRLPIGRKKLSGLAALRRFLKAGHWDLINTHSSTDAWLAALATQAWPEAPPIVRTRHISAAVPKNRASRWLYAHATQHVVTTGEALRQQMLTELALNPAQVTSVPTGVDTARYLPLAAAERPAWRRQLGLPPEGPLIGIVATLRSWKGHRFLLDAFARYAPKNANLLIVGDGPQAQALRQQVEAQQLGARVFLPGNQNDVVPWLQALDVFVLPSYANEGVPQALMQAMSTGLPCITTPVGAILELAHPDKTALVVPPQDVPALGSAMQRMLNDTELAARLAAAARLHIVEHFGIDSMLDRMESVFRATLAATGRQ